MKDIELVLAAVSKEIYMTKRLKSGMMSDTRKIVTDDVLRAATEWFMSNKKTAISFEARNSMVNPTLMYCDNPDKIKRIVEILKEEA